MSSEKDLELIKSLTQYLATHPPFKMLPMTPTRKLQKKPTWAPSWVSTFLVYKISSVLSSSFGWRGSWARAVPSRASLLYLFVAALWVLHIELLITSPVPCLAYSLQWRYRFLFEYKVPFIHVINLFLFIAHRQNVRMDVKRQHSSS